MGGVDRGPPRDAQPSELFMRLSSMQRPSRVVDYPRKDPETGEPVGKVALVPLSEQQMMASRAAADVYARRTLLEHARRSPEQAQFAGDSLGYKDLYVNAVYVEVLTRACREPGKTQIPVFLTSDDLRAALFPDEIAVLLDAYQRWQVESGPIVSELSPEEMERWIDVLAEGAGTVPLALLSSAAQSSLVTSMAARLRSSSTDRSSAGSPPEGSAT